MCGIAGFLTISSRDESRATLERMTASLHHRGPDECGYYADGQAFLGHRRLSIIDLGTGQQPMANEDGSLWIIYNGEIFNHATVRPELEAAGHRYRSHCDTETILHAYEEYGPRSLDRFRGMFAFVIWDAANKTLFCAGTGSVLSRFTTISTVSYSRSRPKSKRCWNIRRFTRSWRTRRFRKLLLSGM